MSEAKKSKGGWIPVAILIATAALGIFKGLKEQQDNEDD